VLNGRDMPGVNGRMYENFTWNDAKAVPPGDDLVQLQKEWPWHYGEGGAGVDSRYGQRDLVHPFFSSSSSSALPSFDSEPEVGSLRVAEVHADNCADGYSGQYNVTLTAFLIGASNRSYYGCTAGWACDQGWIVPREEYTQPLGLPLGPPTAAPAMRAILPSGPAGASGTV